MDINIKLELVREICDHFLEELESKLDEVGIGLDQSDMSEISDVVQEISERSLL